MSHESESQRDDVTKKTLVLRVPGMEDVSVRRAIPYVDGDDPARVLDIYAPPPRATRALPPAIVLAAGYPDAGFSARLGCGFKDMGSSTSWGRLTAASGLAAVTYGNVDPAEDLRKVLDYIRTNGAGLGMDGTRLGLWASSGNVPVAMSALMAPEPKVCCAVLAYGFLLDLDGETGVAEAARRWDFANPCAGKSMEDVTPGRPLFLVRAGADTFPGINASIDAFTARALERNLPLTLVNDPEGHHGFDVFDHTETSREILRRAIDFLRFHLAG